LTCDALSEDIDETIQVALKKTTIEARRRLHMPL